MAECRGCGHTQNVDLENGERRSWRCTECHIKNRIEQDTLEQTYNDGDVSPEAWGGRG